MLEMIIMATQLRASLADSTWQERDKRHQRKGNWERRKGDPSFEKRANTRLRVVQRN